MEQNTTQQVTLLTDKPGRWIIILNCSQLKLVKSIKINLLKKSHIQRSKTLTITITTFLSRQMDAKLQDTAGTTPPRHTYLRYASYQYSPHPPSPSSHPEILFTSKSYLT